MKGKAKEMQGKRGEVGEGKPCGNWWGKYDVREKIGGRTGKLEDGKNVCLRPPALKRRRRRMKNEKNEEE